MTVREWKLSPSDFAFLWEECKRCFYLKIVKDFGRPRSIMPKIFMNIDAQMKARFDRKRTEEIVPALPGGALECGDRWVESEPLVIPGFSSKCHLRGKIDTLIRFDDQTFGVVDFKTSERKPEQLALYSRQLHAYAWALENAAPGKLALSPITKLGLLVFEPTLFSQPVGGNINLSGGLSWIEIPRDDKAFQGFLGEVLDVLDSSAPPASGLQCEWCRYRELSRQTRL